MSFRILLWRSLCFVCLMVLAIGCSQNAHPYSDEEGYSHGLTKSLSTPGQTGSNLAPMSDGPIAQPEGGAESVQRPMTPAANSVLQRKYPNTVVLKGPNNVDRIALTFDDGPDRRFTPQVLDVLQKHHVKATFFLMGSRVKGLPEVTQRIAREGHDIGNHTYWHPKLYAESVARGRWEIKETEQIIQEVVGYRTTLFRAPYGGLTEELVEEMADMGLTVVGWSVDSLDWKGLSKEEVEANVLKSTRPGSIILMHSGGHWTQDLSGMVAALDTIIPELKRRGLQFVTITDMFNLYSKY